MLNSDIEILAPCGSFDILKTAIKAGADACYIGGSRFGARAYADNVSGDQLEAAINYTHIHGKKLYLTVNTLIKENELSDAFDYIKNLIGIDNYRKLKIRAYFTNVKPRGETVEWKEGEDVSPENLYNDSVDYKEFIKKETE